MEADALSTSIFMMNIEAGLALARENGYDVLIVDKTKNSTRRSTRIVWSLQTARIRSQNKSILS